MTQSEFIPMTEAEIAADLDFDPPYHEVSEWVENVLKNYPRALRQLQQQASCGVVMTHLMECEKCKRELQ